MLKKTTTPIQQLSKTSLTDKYKELGVQYTRNFKKAKATEIFKQSFNNDEMLNLASLQQAGQLAIKGNPRSQTRLKNPLRSVDSKS